MKPFKRTVEPLLKDKHKAQRKKFANRTRKSSERRYNENTFSHEKMFDLDDVCNNQNDRLWAFNREETN